MSFHASAGVVLGSLMACCAFCRRGDFEVNHTAVKWYWTILLWSGTEPYCCEVVLNHTAVKWYWTILLWSGNWTILQWSGTEPYCGEVVLNHTAVKYWTVLQWSGTEPYCALPPSLWVILDLPLLSSRPYHQAFEWSLIYHSWAQGLTTKPLSDPWSTTLELSALLLLHWSCLWQYIDCIVVQLVPVCCVRCS